MHSFALRASSKAWAHGPTQFFRSPSTCEARFPFEICRISFNRHCTPEDLAGPWSAYMSTFAARLFAPCADPVAALIRQTIKAIDAENALIFG